PFVAMHAACLAVLLTGVDATALALCGACYLLRMFGVTAGFHRYFSHRSFKTSRWFQFVLACLGCTALQKGPLWWAAPHRAPPRPSATPADPHSARTEGFWWAHLGWVLSPAHKRTEVRRVHDLCRYPELRWLERCYALPAVALAAGCFAAGGWSGLVWGFFV